MFCADWELGLTLWFGLSKLHPPLSSTNYPLLVVPTAAATGGAAVLALHPFDFVRGSTNTTNKSFLKTLSLSTVAFTTFAFGSYLTFREKSNKLNRFAWAFGAAFMGAMAEVPLDDATIKMADNRAVLLAVTRVPQGAMMLFALDEALIVNTS